MAVYYVSLDGDDITGDGSTGTPWRTLEHALETIGEDHIIMMRGNDDIDDPFVESKPATMPDGVSIMGEDYSLGGDHVAIKPTTSGSNWLSVAADGTMSFIGICFDDFANTSSIPAIATSEGATVSMVNCIIRDCSDLVEVDDEVTLNLTLCSILDTASGEEGVIYQHSGYVNITSTVIRRAEWAIRQSGGVCIVKNCFINYCSFFWLATSENAFGQFVNNIVRGFPTHSTLLAVYSGAKILLGYNNYSPQGSTTELTAEEVNEDYLIGVRVSATAMFHQPDFVTYSASGWMDIYDFSNDYHLKSEVGHYVSSSVWSADSTSSPLIGVGDPAYSYSNQPYPNGRAIELGIYGNSTEASRYPYPQATEFHVEDLGNSRVRLSWYLTQPERYSYKGTTKRQEWMRVYYALVGEDYSDDDYVQIEADASPMILEIGEDKDLELLDGKVYNFALVEKYSGTGVEQTQPGEDFVFVYRPKQLKVIDSVLGSGIAFPFSLSDWGRVKISEESEHLKEGVFQMFYTIPGERLMRPEFGIGLGNIVFEAMSEETMLLIQYLVSRGLDSDRRIDSHKLNVFEPSTDYTHIFGALLEDSSYVVMLSYLEADTKSEGTLVFPFNEIGG